MDKSTVDMLEKISALFAKAMEGYILDQDIIKCMEHNLIESYNNTGAIIVPEWVELVPHKENNVMPGNTYTLMLLNGVEPPAFPMLKDRCDYEFRDVKYGFKDGVATITITPPVTARYIELEFEVE